MLPSLSLFWLALIVMSILVAVLCFVATCEMLRAAKELLHK